VIAVIVSVPLSGHVIVTEPFSDAVAATVID
jgi:hypothetical protein